jgi:hypothetical protein
MIRDNILCLADHLVHYLQLSPFLRRGSHLFRRDFGGDSGKAREVECQVLLQLGKATG